MKQFITLPKLKPGDKVSIVASSSDVAAVFPWVLDLGLSRLEKQLELASVEYPTTRQLDASLEDRARDIMAAFADRETKAVISTIGGQDQIKLLKYLDKQVFLDNPKAFFGFSDNTHLGNYLWNLGIPSYYGGAILTQFAFGDEIPHITLEYIQYELEYSKTYNDVTNDWADKANLDKPRLMEPNEPWSWDGDRDAEGVLWGGCLESMVVQSASQIYMPKDDELENTILFLESADGETKPWIAEYILTGFGERGWFDKFQAVLVGRPKAWETYLQIDASQKVKYRQEQRDIFLKIIREYNSNIPVIQGLDFGHTDPQVALPKGGKARIDSTQQKIFLTY